MYTAHIADTPNGRKLTIALEELELDYRIRYVRLDAGEQYSPSFEHISPNNKIPVLVDEASGQGIFESGAILFHLATASGRLIPADAHGQSLVLQWLFLQAASAGPMLGQLWWFRHASPQENAQALERYTRETQRIYRVIERRLAASSHIAGDGYTVADIAFYPWLLTYDELGIDIRDYPRVQAWLGKVGERPAVARGLRKASESAHV